MGKGKEMKVLVIYTGGTIGMIPSNGGLICGTNLLERTVRGYPHFHDPSYVISDTLIEAKTPLVLPEFDGDHRRIIYTIIEYDPLLDSSNMSMFEWIRIAEDIKENYENFDGFVVLHGTDTMAYTAGALSFMIENLGKSVVLTGSQIPLFETRTDGRDNFVNALIIAGTCEIPEVTVCFGNHVFRGNRCTKVSSDSLNAFDTLNKPPLATVGINIQVHRENVMKLQNGPFAVHTTLNENVGLLTLFPSITLETVRVFFEPPTIGVVLQTYGAGNLPTNRPDIFREMIKAHKRGVIIVNCTQCGHGSVAAIYESGQLVEAAGVIPGLDMTPEAALTKLSYCLGRSDWDTETKRKMMQTNLRGELTPTNSSSNGN